MFLSESSERINCERKLIFAMKKALRWLQSLWLEKWRRALGRRKEFLETQRAKTNSANYLPLKHNQSSPSMTSSAQYWQRNSIITIHCWFFYGIRELRKLFDVWIVDWAHFDSMNSLRESFEKWKKVAELLNRISQRQQPFERWVNIHPAFATKCNI